jgi:HEAT repeat protein
MRTAKLSWVLFVLAFGFMGCQEKVVYKGKTVEQWIQALKDKSFLVRMNAALALGYIGPKANKAVPALIEALKDKETVVRGGAALALGEIGPKAEKAVPALIQALNDKDSTVRNYAKEALKKIQKK